KDFGILKAKYGNIYRDESAHKERRKKFSKSLKPFNKAREQVSTKFPHLELLNYSGYGEFCEVLDKEYGKFKGRFYEVLSGRTIHKARRVKYRVQGKDIKELIKEGKIRVGF